MPTLKQIQRGLHYRKLARQGKANRGYCTTCESKTWFIIEKDWLRDNYRCVICRSIPRFRELIYALNQFYPEWPQLSIHESSPGSPSSKLLEKKCKNYSSSQYYDDVPRGEMKGKCSSQDLSRMTFADESFDLFITQDVFEHVIEPDLAFKEIARVLKPGGAHVFTMPWYPKLKHSKKRAILENGKVKLLEEAVYHGNPISNEGSLVTTDWGMDFMDYIFMHSGLVTTVFMVRDRSLGIDGEFLEMFISRKPEK